MRLLVSLLILTSSLCYGQVIIDTVGTGWAKTSVNTAVFRKNSIATHGNTQYVAYYNEEGYVMVGKRSLDPRSIWEVQQTKYKGQVKDAHNCIGIMVDGGGYLHMAWDHHNDPLHYVKSIAPGSLELTDPQIMIGGEDEKRITYPEFHRLASGNLIFLYRSGESGKGNMVVNQYDFQQQQWSRVQSNLIDGEGQRNAYWQAFADVRGTIHLSWVWRESPDVATNHDMCYARSRDGGKTWEKSTGEKYVLPIKMSNAENAVSIPQNSELINQTSMVADQKGNPYIATYWRPEGTTVPQYFLIYWQKNKWLTTQITQRKEPFSLSGVGTRRIPISRPQIMIRQSGRKNEVLMVYRDEERGSKVSMAKSFLSGNNLSSLQWTFTDLHPASVGVWEPTYDTELWKAKGILNLFVQYTGQGSGEQMEEVPPQAVVIMEWK